MAALTGDWEQALKPEFGKDYYRDLFKFVKEEYSTKTIYTTKDKEGNITLDRNYIPLKKISEFDNHELIGYIPSNDEKTGLTWLEPKGKAQNGHIYS